MFHEINRPERWHFDSSLWVHENGMPAEVLLLPDGWFEGKPIYGADPQRDIDELRKRGLDVAAASPVAQADLSVEGWSFAVLVAYEVFKEAWGEILADYLRARWHDVQETMKRVFGEGEASDVLEGSLHVRVGFFKDGGIKWLEAEGDAEEVLEALRHVTPPAPEDFDE